MLHVDTRKISGVGALEILVNFQIKCKIGLEKETIPIKEPAKNIVKKREFLNLFFMNELTEEINLV